MSLPVDIHEVSRRLAVLEERMNTRQAEYRSDLAELMKQIADRNAEMNAEISKWSKGVASRDVVNTRWTIVAIVAALAAAVALLSWQDSQQAPAAAPQPQPIIIQLPPQTLAPVSQPPAAPVGATAAEPGPREPWAHLVPSRSGTTGEARPATQPRDPALSRP